MAAGIELVADKNSKDPFPFAEKKGIQVCKAAQKRGLLIRPLVNVITFIPPLCISDDEINFAMNLIEESIEEVLPTKTFSK